VDWDARRRAIYLPPDMRLDLGGIVKGWAADEAARRLSACGPALVDAGGDIAVSGPRASGGGWPVAIQSVENAAAPADQQWLLLLRGGGVATSGRDYRRWQQHGTWQHHIIDPRSGSPAQTDVLAATVLARSASEAEVVAKYVFLLGSDAGIAWLDNRKQFAGLLQLADGRCARSSNLASHLWTG
jgi:thiamine biosynthesis lipoprotein